jgi:hypothetical protein
MPQVLEGTWEELKQHENELAGKRFRLVPLPPKQTRASSTVTKSRSSAGEEATTDKPRQLTGMGKFAGIIPSSEEFARMKQEEIDLEERKVRG